MSLPHPFEEYKGLRKLVLRGLLDAYRKGLSPEQIALEMRIPEAEVRFLIRMSPASIPLNTYESAAIVLKNRSAGMLDSEQKWMCGGFNIREQYLFARYPGYGQIRDAGPVTLDEVLCKLNSGMTEKEILRELHKANLSRARTRSIFQHLVKMDENGIYVADLIDDKKSLLKIKEMSCVARMSIEEIAEQFDTVSLRIVESMTRAIRRIGPYATSPSFHNSPR